MDPYFIYISAGAIQHESINRAMPLPKNTVFINKILGNDKHDRPDYSRLSVSGFDKASHNRSVLVSTVRFQMELKTIMSLYKQMTGIFMTKATARTDGVAIKRRRVRKTGAFPARQRTKNALQPWKTLFVHEGVHDRGKFNRG